MARARKSAVLRLAPLYLVGEGVLFGATLAALPASGHPKPPHYAPSLRSVAGLLLALALQSACEDTLTSLTQVRNSTRGPAAHAGKSPGAPTRARRYRDAVDERRGAPRAQARELFVR